MGINKRAFVSSFTHQWLPLNEQLQRREAIGTSVCPMCDHAEEDDLHFLCCEKYLSERIPPIERVIAEVTKRLGVDPLLKVILIRGLQAGRRGRKEISMDDIPVHYKQLVISQQTLGWEQLWYARWSKKWGEWQEQYLRDEEMSMEKPREWITQAIRSILTSVHERWKLRGKTLDGETHNQQERSTRERLERMYEMREKLPRRYRFLLEKDIGERRSMGPRALQRWIRMTEPLLRKGLRTMGRRSRVSKRMEAWVRWRRRRRKSRKKN